MYWWQPYQDCAAAVLLAKSKQLSADEMFTHRKCEFIREPQWWTVEHLAHRHNRATEFVTKMTMQDMVSYQCFYGQNESMCHVGRSSVTLPWSLHHNLVKMKYVKKLPSCLAGRRPQMRTMEVVIMMRGRGRNLPKQYVKHLEEIVKQNSTIKPHWEISKLHYTYHTSLWTWYGNQNQSKQFKNEN